MSVPEEIKKVVICILLERSTKDAQDYLIKELNVTRNETCNYIKKLRKQLNIYKNKGTYDRRTI